jgi:uncharacterized protein YaaQ
LKLVIAIVHERDKQKIGDSLLQAGLQFTVIATTGGFLRDGNSTMLIGAPQERVDEIMELIRSCCSIREQFVAQPPLDMVGTGGMLMNPIKVSVGGAIVFVVDVERFERV